MMVMVLVPALSGCEGGMSFWASSTWGAFAGASAVWTGAIWADAARYCRTVARLPSGGKAGLVTVPRNRSTAIFSALSSFGSGGM